MGLIDRPPAQNMLKSYFSKIQDVATKTLTTSASAKASEGLLDILRMPDRNSTKVFYTNTKEQPQILSPSDLIACANSDRDCGREAICVIENISPTFIEALGSEWNLDPEFFIGHSTNPKREDLWVYRPWQMPERDYDHLDGTFEYHGHTDPLDPSQVDGPSNYFRRDCFQTQNYPFQSNTRISYYRVRHSLCKYEESVYQHSCDS
jgi:hypothetical protein